MTVQFKYENKECALEAVTKNGFNLAHCTPELKNDEQVVMAAIKACDWAFQDASEELKSNKVFIMKALNEGVDPWYLIQYSNIHIKSDIDVVSLAVEKSRKGGLDFKFAQGEVAINKELAAKALVNWGKLKGKNTNTFWKEIHPTLQEFFPKDSWYEKSQSYLYQLEQEKQAEMVVGGCKDEDEVVW